MRGGRPANDDEVPLRAVDPEWDIEELTSTLQAMSADELEALLKSVGIQPPRRLAPSSPAAAPTTRRAAMATIAAVAVAVALPIAVVPTPEVPDILDGMARDFMRDNPALSYAEAYELALIH